VMSLVISRVGSSRPMFLMAIWRTLLLMPVSLNHVFVHAGPPVAAGAGDDGGCPVGGGQVREAGELGLAALAQGEPGDAAAGQLVEDGVGGELGVEDQQPGVDPVAFFQ